MSDRLQRFISLRRVTRRAVALPFLAVLAGCSDTVTEPHGEIRTPVLQLRSVEASGADVNVVLRWNQAALEAVSNGTLGPPMVARALAIAQTAVFDAWAAYDDRAVGTRLGGSLRRPAAERTIVHKTEAISYAAYRALVDLYPAQVERFDAQMEALGFDPSNLTTDVSTPAGIGNVVAAALLESRHSDGPNQLGTLGASGLPYSDYTGYQPVNTPDEVNDPNYWQPLRHPNRAGTSIVEQRFLGVHRNRVIPFALASADQFRPPPPKRFPHGRYRQQAQALIRISAKLTDRHKVIAEYWADGPNTVLPPGHFVARMTPPTQPVLPSTAMQISGSTGVDSPAHPAMAIADNTAARRLRINMGTSRL